MDLGLNGRVCVVTGASRGIGLAISRRLAAEGAQVVMVARDEGRLARAAEEVEGAEWIAADVTDPDCVARIVATAEEQLGGLDVLVNNAGTSSHVPLMDLPDDEWHAQHELNVMAPMRLMRLAAPRMAQRGWGRIVNVSSSSGKRPGQSNVAYSVAKAGQLSLSRAFADAYASKGVLVNAVAPGPTATDLFLKGKSDELVERFAKATPLERLGTPQDIGSVVAFLAGPDGSWVNGQVLRVNGGLV
jgi:3-oxoacyl-[acyl-carrier protein] reductase